jgi:hypothetical protein
LNTGVDQPLSRDEPPDYEDLDYSQLIVTPRPNMDIENPECYALEPVGNNVPEVVYHVLEGPDSIENPECHALEPVGNNVPEVVYHVLEEPDSIETPECYALEPVGNNAPEVVYHVLEEPDFNEPTYQNVTVQPKITLNPLYEPAASSAPFVEANVLYDG